MPNFYQPFALETYACGFGFRVILVLHIAPKARLASRGVEKIASSKSREANHVRRWEVRASCRLSERWAAHRLAAFSTVQRWRTAQYREERVDLSGEFGKRNKIPSNSNLLGFNVPILSKSPLVIALNFIKLNGSLIWNKTLIWKETLFGGNW